MLSARDVSHAYGSLRALDRITFTLDRGQTLAIFGPNGAGKTTLLKVLAGLIQPRHGTVQLAGGRRAIGWIGWAVALALPKITDLALGGILRPVVLIEKPITVTLAEADELLAVAATQGALVQIGHIERFNRAIRAAWPYVDEPLFIESERLAPFNPRGSDVAVVLDLMIHDIDLVLTLTKAKVTEVRAAGVGILTKSVDIADARVAFANGAIATANAAASTTRFTQPLIVVNRRERARIVDMMPVRRMGDVR